MAMMMSTTMERNMIFHLDFEPAERAPRDDVVGLVLAEAAASWFAVFEIAEVGVSA